MADLASKLAENAVGKYYVDLNCIDCDLCRITAPNNFKELYLNLLVKHLQEQQSQIDYNE